jgi:hypothetical protein
MTTIDKESNSCVSDHDDDDKYDDNGDDDDKYDDDDDDASVINLYKESNS